MVALVLLALVLIIWGIRWMFVKVRNKMKDKK